MRPVKGCLTVVHISTQLAPAVRVYAPAGCRSGAVRLPSDGTNTYSDCVIRVNTD